MTDPTSIADDRPARACILVVHDHALTREAVAEVLGDEGYEVLVACDPREAREAFQGCQLDLVLTDLHRPGDVGLHALRLARERQPALPVLLLTTDAARDARDEDEPLAASDYLDEPLDLDEMLGRVQCCLRAPQH